MEKKEKITRLTVGPAPHLKSSLTIEKMMWWTAAALLLPSAGGVYFFGMKALLLIVSCSAAALLFDAAGQYLRGLRVQLTDGSAAVTGILVALILPPSFPVWAAVLGTAFSILIVKHVFGGLGKNIFNPALMGRAFLTAAFPVLITTYSINCRTLPGYDAKMSGAGTEAVTGATPLSGIKFENAVYSGDSHLNFFLGQKKGSTGETSGILILAGFIILLANKVIDWRLSASYFMAIFGFSGALWLTDPVANVDPFLYMTLGGILLGGVFMVTDPVTTPVTGRGKWIFGIGAGILTVVIRNFSGYPEGVMFSIILMNSVTPLINRMTRPRIYGT
ncbi:MAG: RnfABCDGE type electron transport complex subunit D [Elusimicrobia bacterium]|nr:RnfABCDGE type electron transport complex subunit D [Elusimicrobiota bacterium]